MLDSLKKLDSIWRGSYSIVTSFEWSAPHQGKPVVESSAPSLRNDEAGLRFL